MEPTDDVPPEPRIPSERKTIYYVGMAMIVLGLVVFLGTFISGPDVGGNHLPAPGAPDFWDRVQSQQAEFSRGMKTTMVRALAGMGLMVIGGLLMQLGARGAAGSGLVLDPVVRVRCGRCKGLNEESAKFCSSCGVAM